MNTNTPAPSPASVAATITREIKRRNRVFTAADDAGKRVLIAKDVLEQVRLGRFIPETSKYAMIRGFKGLGGQTQDIQQCVLTPGITCECCGVGSLMLSTILFRDQVKADVGWNDSIYLDPGYETTGDNNITFELFGKAQLDLIEIAFERWYEGDAEDSISSPSSYTHTPELADSARTFGERYDDDKDRLVAIMKNIIANDGTFKP